MESLLISFLSPKTEVMLMLMLTEGEGIKAFQGQREAVDHEWVAWVGMN